MLRYPVGVELSRRLEWLVLIVPATYVKIDCGCVAFSFLPFFLPCDV